MAKRNRETLKNHFRQGAKPTQQAFEDLIDSMLNTMDDGFSGSPHIGIGLSPLTEKGTVISTYRSPGDQYPSWEFVVDKTTGDLLIKRCRKGISRTVLTLKYEQEPGHTHEAVFGGMVCCDGIKGNFIRRQVPADGQWHDLLEDSQLEEGCPAFDIMAGCGERNKGRYALLHATAMHCYGSRRKIKKVRSNFGLWGNRICLRWVKIKDRFACRLQIKTALRYGPGILIDCRIARLWDNPTMEERL
ncbi:MAG: hypothetical protein LUG98_10950 [Tannerellaceae bacterium]|nr:hypothetical protein [Tannerellaceae bacterium]